MSRDLGVAGANFGGRKKLKRLLLHYREHSPPGVGSVLLTSHLKPRNRSNMHENFRKKFLKTLKHSDMGDAIRVPTIIFFRLNIYCRQNFSVSI